MALERGDLDAIVNMSQMNSTSVKSPGINRQRARDGSTLPVSIGSGAGGGNQRRGGGMTGVSEINLNVREAGPHLKQVGGTFRYAGTSPS